MIVCCRLRGWSGGPCTIVVCPARVPVGLAACLLASSIWLGCPFPGRSPSEANQRSPRRLYSLQHSTLSQTYRCTLHFATYMWVAACWPPDKDLLSPQWRSSWLYLRTLRSVHRLSNIGAQCNSSVVKHLVHIARFVELDVGACQHVSTVVRSWTNNDYRRLLQPATQLLIVQTQFLFVISVLSRTVSGHH